MEPLPADSALWALPNVLLSPHCADRTSTFQQDAMRQFGANVARYVAGQPLLNIVDKARLARCVCAMHDTMHNATQCVSCAHGGCAACARADGRVLGSARRAAAWALRRCVCTAGLRRLEMQLCSSQLRLRLGIWECAPAAPCRRGACARAVAPVRPVCECSGAARVTPLEAHRLSVVALFFAFCCAQRVLRLRATATPVARGCGRLRAGSRELVAKGPIGHVGN